MSTVGILGAGAFGMALAKLLWENGHEVRVWSAVAREIEEYSATRIHPGLHDMPIPETIELTLDPERVCSGCELLINAVASPYVRSTVASLLPRLSEGQILVNASKGLENGSFMTMTDIMEEEASKAGRSLRIVELSGPTQADEIAAGIVSTVVVASRDREAALFTEQCFDSPRMLAFSESDMQGIELCGSMKNVIALAVGIATGLGGGDNTRAAVMTRGFAEMKRLGTAMGCPAESFEGLAGLGDMILTASSENSRNNRCGRLLGQGVALEEALKEIGMVVEGFNTLPAVLALGDKYQVALPLCEGVQRIAYEGADPGEELLRMLEG